MIRRNSPLIKAYFSFRSGSEGNPVVGDHEATNPEPYRHSLLCRGDNRVLPQVGVLFSAYSPNFIFLYTGARLDRNNIVFVLRGFVIHYDSGGLLSKYKVLHIHDFFVARIARLYPLYILVIGITLAFLPNPWTTEEFRRSALFISH